MSQAQTPHFENTYRCLECNESFTVETDEDVELGEVSECPVCETEDSVILRENREQTRAVDMDILSQDEYRFVLDHCIGQTFVWEDADRIFEAADFDPDATETVEGVEMEFTRIYLEYASGSTGSQGIDDFYTNVKVGNYQKVYGVPEERARASQYYVIRVVNAPETSNADEGDIEFSVTDLHYSEGDTITSSMPGPGPKKRWEVVAGPFDCPRMPNVLALERWIGETRPDEVAEYVPEDFYYDCNVDGVWRRTLDDADLPGDEA